MRKPGIAFVYILLFCLAVFKGLQIFSPFVPFSFNRKHFRISVRNDQRCNDNRQNNTEQYYQADDRKRIAKQFADSVLKKGNGFRHDILLLFLFFRSGRKLAQINLCT